MYRQGSLSGELKVVIHISEGGSADAYLLHLPSRRSSYGNTLLAKCRLFLTDEELLEGDWGRRLDRVAGGLANSV